MSHILELVGDLLDALGVGELGKGCLRSVAAVRGGGSLALGVEHHADTVGGDHDVADEGDEAGRKEGPGQR